MNHTLFLSHSQRDKERIGTLSKALGHTYKKLYTDYWENQETLPASKRLREHISDSDAVLVYWGPSVEENDVTKIWVGWEVGVATEMGVPIFVLEDTKGMVTLPIPALTDYAVLDPTDEDSLRQLSNAIDRSLQFHIANSRLMPNMAITRQKRRFPDVQSFECVNCKQKYLIWLKAKKQKVICPSCNKPGKEFGADRVV